MGKQTRLRIFIDKHGIDKLAKALEVHPTTVSHWRTGRVLPKSEQMLTIKELSNGELTPDHMIEDYFKNSGNRGKYTK